MTQLTDADLLARLVAFDSTSRNSNLPLVRFLADYLDRPGIAVRELPGPEGPDGGKANLFVRVGPPLDPEGHRPGLVLSGHTDVVPADDTDRWTSDPFVLTDRGDRWVARGSADMKGFVALAANLALEADPGRMRHPLVLLFTYDEEVGCLGAGHLRRTWGEAEGTAGEALPRSAVIGEPTELQPVRIHKGHLKVRLTYPGVSAHSAYPHLGVNAIEGAAEGVRALVALKEELARERVGSSASFPDAPYAALNVGTVRGGVAVNVVPDRCVLEVGVRLLPGMDADAVVERVIEATGAEREGSARPVLEVLSVSPPMTTSGTARVVEALVEASGSGDAGAVSFATDAGWLAEMGMDCAIWGPGSIEVAHKPDEFLPKADLARARELLVPVVERFCGGEA